MKILRTWAWPDPHAASKIVMYRTWGWSYWKQKSDAKKAEAQRQAQIFFMRMIPFQTEEIPGETPPERIH